ncbi:hypothetical protein PGB90_003987 [Kerria lacca]
MRELARLLIEIQRRLNNPTLTLAESMITENYTVIVESAKFLGGYNQETKTFEKAPNFTINEAEFSINDLTKNKFDKDTCKVLVDSCLILTILYNRRRTGDVQYTHLETYLRSSNNNSQNLKEYEGMAEKYVCGEKFIKKFDEKSHANNPQLITSNNL